MGERLNNSLAAIEREIEWLSGMITFRFSEYFKQSIERPIAQAPNLDECDSYYAELIRKFELDEVDRIILMVALVPHIRPSVLDVFFTKNERIDRGFSEFGGLKGEKHSGFIPTAETAAFIIAGKSLEARFKLQERFGDDHPLCTHNILTVGETKSHEPMWSGELVVSKELLTKLTLNKPFEPRFSAEFPAELMTTTLEWSDAVLDAALKSEIEHLQTWIEKKEEILENQSVGRFLKSGYRVLFYGPPGTGKSMTAALLGKSNGIQVYRVDLSAVVSKYIGETEKNLSRLFDMAEHKNWILFFDEADALFSKRMSTRSSNDMFANQQVSYLLQRIENYNGLVILATNFKENLDEAFLRRFQSIVAFSKPNEELRRELWEHYFQDFVLNPEEIKTLAHKYEITGGGIINVLRYCAIIAARRGSNVIQEADLLRGIKRELLKEGLTL